MKSAFIPSLFPDKCQAYVNSLASGRRARIRAAAADFRAKDTETFKNR